MPSFLSSYLTYPLLLLRSQAVSLVSLLRPMHIMLPPGCNSVTRTASAKALSSSPASAQLQTIADRMDCIPADTSYTSIGISPGKAGGIAASSLRSNPIPSTHITELAMFKPSRLLLKRSFDAASMPTSAGATHPALSSVHLALLGSTNPTHASPSHCDTTQPMSFDRYPTPPHPIQRLRCRPCGHFQTESRPPAFGPI